MKHSILFLFFVYSVLIFGCKKNNLTDPVESSRVDIISSYYPFPSDVGKVVFESENLFNRSVASPSILVLPNGDYLISHTYNRYTMIHVSKDKGQSWTLLSRVFSLNFATLFEHKGNVYLTGTLNAVQGDLRGDIVIVRSTDNGRTWSEPKDENTGILFRGLFHTAPVPVVKHQGKIWRAYEEVFNLSEDRDFHAFVAGADEDADLLKASSWMRTNSIRYEESWINASVPNWLEGNVVVTPEDKLVNFLRLETRSQIGTSYAITGPAQGKPRNEIAAVIEIDVADMKAEFRNEPRNYVHFPGGETKFTIRYDPVSKLYWTIANKITSFKHTNYHYDYDGNWHQRNVLVLMSSPNLVDWEEKRMLLRWNEGAHLRTWDIFGFQYADWQFDQEDLVYVSRTSWYGRRYHDANMIVFHRVKNFRSSSAPDPEDLLKYTKHPKLLDIPATAIKNGGVALQDFNIDVVIGEGIDIDGDGKITLKNQTIANDENQAVNSRRYFDVMIKNTKGNNFSMETLDFSTIADTRNFSIKWMFSTDGRTFNPLTEFMHRVETSAAGLKFSPPLYLSMYKNLNNISGNTGVTLRCAIIRGNGDGIFMKFEDVLSIGGRIL